MHNLIVSVPLFHGPDGTGIHAAQRLDIIQITVSYPGIGVKTVTLPALKYGADQSGEAGTIDLEVRKPSIHPEATESPFSSTPGREESHDWQCRA